MKAGLLPLQCGLLQRQKYQPLHPGSFCHSRVHLTTSPYALHLGLQRLHKPCGGEEPVESGQLPVITGILCKEITDPYEVMGSAVMATRLLRYPTTGAIFIDIKFCAEGIVGLGLDPMANDCPALQELSDLDD